MFNNNLLMGAASASGESLVSVGNSALFDSANSEYLSRTPSSAGNRDTWTISYWVYKTYISGAKAFFTAGSDNTNVTELRDQGTGILEYRHQDGGSITDNIITTAIFRDIGWYHIVWAVDTTQAVESSRIILYVNGERITDFSTANYPAQNADTDVNATVPTNIGARTGPDQYWSGYMAEAVLIDGLQLTPTSFGQYDSTGTFWTPKSSAEIKALTFGTNGYYLDNTTNAQTDASGNGNNFTNNNTVVTSTHTPTNLNALWNPLSTVGLTTRFPELSVGNTTTGYSGSTSARAMLTLPVFYNTHLEFTVTQGSGSDTNYPFLQVFPYSTDDYSGDILVNQSAAGGSGGTGLASGASIPNWTTGDRVTLEIDTTNGRIYVFIDGSAVNSANPGAGSGFTFDFTMPASGQLAIVWINQTSAGKTVVVSNPAEFTDSVSTGYFGLTSTIVAAQTTRTKSNLEEYFDTTLYEGNGAGQRVGKFLPFTDTFTVGNSALFDRANSESLSKTPSGAGSSTTTGTFNVWIKQGLSLSNRGPLIYVDGSGSDFQIELNISGNNKLRVDLSYSAANHVKLSTQAFKDTSQWSMVTCILDTSNGTASERIRLYWNSNRLALTTDNTIDQNQAIIIGSAVEHQIGALETSYFYDGYMSEVVYIDGTALEPSNFGQVDTSTGRWIPKDVSGLTFGTNGFYLNFANSSDVGNDVSGNNNDFTNNNTVVQSNDTPTVNFAVFDGNFVQSGFVLSNGNQTADASSTNKWGTITLPITTGKWFGVATTTDANSRRLGVASNEEDFVNLGSGNIPTDDEYAWAVALSNTTTVVARNDGTNITGTIQTIDRTNDRYAVAIDCDNRKVWLGVYDNSAGNIQWIDGGGTVRTTDVPASGVNETYSLTGTSWRFFVEHGDTGSAQTIDFGQSSFGGASLPSGFLGLNQDNMPAGESYQTAFSWIKNRDATDNHMLFDRVRGIYNDMHSNASSNQVTNVNTLQRFLNGGVQVGNDVEVNTANESYVAWNWYMQTTGSGTSNTDGTINTTATLVDTNLGLSISEFTGTGANATIGHGLGVVPQMYWVKGIDGGDHWYVYHANNTAAPETDALLLNGTTATFDDATLWNDTAPTSSVISLGSSTGVNQSSKKYLAMAFAPSQFTSIGSYEGNSNANGTFIPTVNSLGVPIQPSWFLHKCADTGLDWYILDSVSQTYNVLGPQVLSPNTNEAAPSTASTYREADFVTGGIKIRGAGDQINNSNTHIYMAFGTPIIDVDGRIITGF